MTEAEALSALGGPCEKRAAEALDRLSPPARRYLGGCLRAWSIPPDLRDDLIQETLLRVWRGRAGFRDQGPAGWLAFLRTCARNVLIDRKRAGDLDPSVALDDDVPAEGPPWIADLLRRESLAGTARVVRGLADRALLYRSRRTDPEALLPQILSAQLFYVDRLPWQTVLAAQPHGPGGEAPSRARLDECLRDPNVLIGLAFRHLHFPRERLTGALFSPGDGIGEPWTAEETRVLVWRYRHGLSEAQIRARTDCPLEEAGLERLSVRLVAALPFLPAMDRLLQAWEECGVDGRALLEGPPVWQRLAFEHWYFDDLALKEIEERLAGPAARVGFSLSPATLNVWLSGGRLLNRVVEAGKALGLLEADE